MNLRDRDPRKNAKMMDKAFELNRFKHDKYRTMARLLYPEIRKSKRATDMRTMEVFNSEDPDFLEEIEQDLLRKQREPHGLGQLERMKERTDHFNPMGEMCGGNFRA